MSLIEAVVAMGVMAFGMLAVVGLQVTLRTTGDLSKQRAEAVRLAQQGIEDWRSLVAMEVTAGAIDYQDLVTDGPVTIAGLNATYVRGRQVSIWDGGSPAMKSLSSSVTWTDRTGTSQTVQLSSVVAGVSPDLAGSLALPPSGVPARQPLGRSNAIPSTAKSLGNGTSGFVPPQSGGGTVTWVFNDSTGLIVGICNASGVSDSSQLTGAIVAGCSTSTKAQLLSGYVRFADTSVQPTAAQAEAPTGVPLNLDLSLAPGPTSQSVTLTWSCYDDAATVAPIGSPGAAVRYYCAITSSASGTWAGRSRIAPVGWTISSAGAGNYVVCRYTGLASDTGTSNASHPLDYTESGSAAFASLVNQNFLVISAQHSCPSDTIAAGDFVNSNTRLHQNGSTSYSNP
jgi:Tfp pilus assembly protein PilV